MYLPHIHTHTVHLWATHSNRYWHILFLVLAQWAAGRGYWKSGAAHTLDIYKTSNHWNHRNVLFHFSCQTSCHADHTAAIQSSNSHCTTLSFPSLSLAFSPLPSFLSFFSHSVFYALSVLFSCFHTFISLSLSLSRFLSLALSLTSLCPAWVTGLRLTDSQVFEISTSAFRALVWCIEWCL